MTAPQFPQRPRILAYPGLGGFEAMFTNDFNVVSLPTDKAERAAALAAGLLHGVEAAVTIGSIGVPAEALAAAPDLRLIAAFGVGYDGLDVAALAARGVAVTNCPQINHEDVADVAMGLILSCARHIAAGDRLVRAGGWSGPLAFPPPRRLKGRKLGIVGMGSIGQALAARAQAFGMTIAWTGPRPKPDLPFPYQPNLLTLAQESDILTLCLRPDPGTEGMIGAEVLNALGPQGMVINVARGSVIDEDALIAALKAGAIAAAGLDVFAQEPTSPARWAEVPNVTLTPHLAGGTRESILEAAQLVLENLRRSFAGQPLLTPVSV